jgi:3-deoxy-7-phosphoheptulonate synthase/chorismate mutase
MSRRRDGTPSQAGTIIRGERDARRDARNGDRSAGDAAFTDSAAPASGATSLSDLRAEIDAVNEEILGLLQERAAIVVKIAQLKRSQGLAGYDPGREEEMLQRLTEEARGDFGPAQIKEIFQTIFRVSLDIQDEERSRLLRVRARDLLPEGVVRVGGVAVGGSAPILFAGPCSVETPEQMDEIATRLAAYPGPKILRAGAFKPRTNPHSFQGLREEGLAMLREAADRHGLVTVTEVPDTATLDVVARYSDMLQVGARNMYNTELLKALGGIGKPVLLKRGFMATLEELLLSAEYVLLHGNESVVLCERGIRTFEPWTRNTLDIAAIPLLKKETRLPVIVDLSHATGRTDILAPCGRAALAAGADGIMIETHPHPEQALSDGFQQIDFAALDSFLRELGWHDASRGAASRGRAHS